MTGIEKASRRNRLIAEQEAKQTTASCLARRELQWVQHVMGSGHSDKMLSNLITVVVLFLLVSHQLRYAHLPTCSHNVLQLNYSCCR